MIKVAKIIAVSFSYPRTYRERTILTGNPPLFTLHSQNISNYIDIKNMIMNHITFENNNYNKNIKLDLIFINNDVGFDEGNKWLYTLTELKTNFGLIKVFNRKNKGWSYGAYSYAIDNFINLYDYFIFTEDDVYICGDNYINEAINKFESISKCGFLSFQGLSNTAFEHKGLDYLHARGGVGLTSAKILIDIKRKIDYFPYYDNNEIESYKNIILQGEVAFTNIIYKNGYLLDQISFDKKIVFYDYDHRRNIDLKLQPTFFELLKYKIDKHFKSFCYNILIKLKLYTFYKKIKKFTK
jgi:hypothetical protein